MIGGGYLIYYFSGIHFEPKFYPPLTLNRFLNSSNMYIDAKVTRKICAEFSKA
jgi:hypothetical protein